MTTIIGKIIMYKKGFIKFGGIVFWFLCYVNVSRPVQAGSFLPFSCFKALLHVCEDSFNLALKFVFREILSKVKTDVCLLCPRLAFQQEFNILPDPHCETNCMGLVRCQPVAIKFLYNSFHIK